MLIGYSARPPPETLTKGQSDHKMPFLLVCVKSRYEILMNKRQLEALAGFASAVQELKDAGVIRSDRYLGDIAEFLCADAYGITLVPNLRQTGHDGIRENLRVQIKFGGGEKTNMDLGDPDKYDELYVVLGKASKVRSHAHDADFLIYKMTSEEVKSRGLTKKGRYSRGGSHFCHLPDKSISLTQPVGAVE